MTLLPIVARELRVASRRRLTFWMRSGIAFLAVGLGFCIFCANWGEKQSVVGPFIFYGLSALALLYCLGSGSRFTVDCVSTEKREGTLGLLFLTDLKGYDVILGKLAATSITGFYGLLAIFPILAIPLMMGGINYGEFWRVVLVLLDTFLFSLAVGIFVSVMSREARAAMAANLLILLVLVILCPVAMGVLAALGKNHVLCRELALPSPGYAFVMSLDRPYQTESKYFWESVGLIHATTWALVLVASFRVTKVWQDKPVKSARTGFRQWWRYGGVQTRAKLRQRLLDVNAWFWLAARDRRKPVRVWIFLGLIAAAWVWGLLKADAEVRNELQGFCVMTALLLNVTFKIWVAAEAGESLAANRHLGALELLFSTPLTARDVLRGQRLALQRQFLGPVIVGVIAELVFMWYVVHRAGNAEVKALLTFWLTGIFLFFADVAALYWVGMYTALISRTSNQAASAVMLRILVLPWIVFGFLQMIVGMTVSYFRLTDPGWGLFYAFWLGLGLITDIGFGWHARRQLLRNFRELPSRRVGFFWGILGRRVGSAYRRYVSSAK